MFRTLFFAFVFFALLFRPVFAFERLDLVEVEIKNNHSKKEGFFEKGSKDKKYAVVFSGSLYNKESKYVITAPVVLKDRDQKGKFTTPLLIGGKEYVALSGILKNSLKARLTKSNISLTEKEKKMLLEQFNNITK